jgi:deoxyribodipyrimidine photolyase
MLDITTFVQGQGNEPRIQIWRPGLCTEDATCVLYWMQRAQRGRENHALNTADTTVYLNDKYELDGRDANGYTGISWAIGGRHDRPWRERPIFGLIRYMSANGMKQKIDTQSYIYKHGNSPFSRRVL